MAKATRYLSLKIGMKIINKNVLLCFLWFLLVFLNGESNLCEKLPFLYFPVVSGSATNLVNSVFVKKLSGFVSLRLKILLGNLIPPKILHQSSIDTPSFLHRSDGPSMEYRWSIDGVSYMEKGRMCGFRPLEERKFPACAERLRKQIRSKLNQ